MPAPDQHDPLLDDLLSDADPPGFRAALLNETLQLAGKRRRWRQGRRSATVLAVVALGVILASQWRGPSQSGVVSATRSYTIVRTEPLAAHALVHTLRLDAERVVVSTSGVTVVHTTATSGRVRMIGDDELLAIVAPRPAALVRQGPGSARLIFAEPDAAEEWPLN